MKFQDSSFNGLKVTVGTKSVKHAPTHAPTHTPTHARSKSNMPHQLFQSWGHNHLTKAVPHFKDSNRLNGHHHIPQKSVYKTE